MTHNSYITAQTPTLASPSKTGIIIADYSGKISMANTQALSLFGFEPNNIAGKNICSLFPLPVQDTADAIFNNNGNSAAHSVEMLTDEVAFRALCTRNDGSQFFSYINTIRLANSESMIAIVSEPLVTGGDSDCTEQELSRSLIERAYDAFVAIDKESVITQWNLQAEKTFGWSKNEAIGRRLDELIIPPLFRERHIQGVENFLASGRGSVMDKRLEVQALCKAGNEIPIELAIFPLKTATGYIFGAFLHDISERKEAELRIKEFYGIISHELRAPLTSIIGVLELVQAGTTGEVAPEASQLLSIASKEAHRLVGLVNEILDLKKIEAGKLDLIVEILDGRSIVGHVIDAVQGLLKEKNICVVEDVEQDSQIYSDRCRTIQVLMNLVSNAIKFSPKGANVVIKMQQMEGDKIVRFSVIDNGPGIAQDGIRKLFGKFEQLETANNQVYPGTGLGLCISKLIIEQLGGAIGIDSQQGNGSTFWFELPAPNRGMIDDD